MNNKSFTLKFTGNATNKGSMRNDIDVSFESMNETFKLATDEGAFHGGKGTAPPPLALFTASLCGCIMTQIKAFGKKLKIEVNEIEIDEKDLTCTVEPGVVLDELNRRLKPFGLWFPVDVSTSSRATIGGMAAVLVAVNTIWIIVVS